MEWQKRAIPRKARREQEFNKGSEWLARVRGLADNETGWVPINLLRKIA